MLSVEGIQQQQDGTDANDTSKDERVTPLPEVDPLYQAVHGRKAVFGKPWLRSYLREASLMKSYRNHKQPSVQSINGQGLEPVEERGAACIPAGETQSTQSVDGAVRAMGRKSVEKITAARIHWSSWAWAEWAPQGRGPGHTHILLSSETEPLKNTRFSQPQAGLLLALWCPH